MALLSCAYEICLPCLPPVLDLIALTKIVTALIYPIGLIFSLLLLSLLLRLLSRTRSASLLLALALLVAVLASNPRFATYLLRSLEQQYPQQALDEIPAADLIVVLGGGLRLPQSPALYAQFTGGSDRYWHARRLYLAGKASKIVLAGGNVFAQPDLQSEAWYAAQMLQQWGIPADAIVIEGDSRNTAQNMRLTRDIVEAAQAQHIILVTSGFHMPRAIRLFSSLPVDVIPASADIIYRDMVRPGALDWLPSAQALALTTLVAHEYYGMAFVRLKALIGRA